MDFDRRNNAGEFKSPPFRKSRVISNSFMGRRESQNEVYWAAVMAGTWSWSLTIPSSQKLTEASRYTYAKVTDYFGKSSNFKIVNNSQKLL